jgi:cytochrome P450
MTQLGEKEAVDLDVVSWLSRCTLDIIGLAGFGYTFDALAGNGAPNELLSAFSTIFGASSPSALVTMLNLVVPGFRHVVRTLHTSVWSGTVLTRVQPTERNRQRKNALSVMMRIGEQLLAERKAAATLEAAQGEKITDSRARDLLSLLVRANTAANPRERLSDADVLGRECVTGISTILSDAGAEIPTFLLAGHETTSSLLSWILFELAANPDTQARLRAECRKLSLPTGGAPRDADRLAALDKLPQLDAVVRETLRLHAPAASTLRTAQQDDILPLSRPFVDTKGVEQTTISYAPCPFATALRATK